MIDRYLYLSQTELLARPGWTAGAQRDFLGQPDELGPNPYNPRSPARLYLRERVEAVERTAAWEEHLGALARRRERAKRSKPKFAASRPPTLGPRDVGIELRVWCWIVSSPSPDWKQDILCLTPHELDEALGWERAIDLSMPYPLRATGGWKRIDELPDYAQLHAREFLKRQRQNREQEVAPPLTEPSPKALN